MAFKAIPVVAAKVSGTHSNFPVYLKPSAISGWGALTSAEAASLRFYSDEAKTTELAREIVGAGDEIHVKVPSLTTTTTIYADYDGVRADYAVTDTYGRNAVWSDYEWVLHGTLSSGALVDSAGNITTTKQTANTPTNPAGTVGDGFNPNSAYWTTSYNPFTAIGTGALTFQTWSNFSAGAGSRRSVIYMGRNVAFNDVMYVQVLLPADSDSNQQVATFREGTAGQTDVGPNAAVDGTSNMYHYTRTGTNGKCYLDATLADNTTNAEIAASLGVSGNSVLTIAAAYTTGVQPSGSVVFDEMRLRGAELSANWITTEHNNQSDVATFWGTVTDAGGGGANPTGFFAFF